MKKFLVCLALFTIMLSYTVLADNEYNERWLTEAGSVVYTDINDPLIGYGSYNVGNVHQTPWYSYCTSVNSGVSVYFITNPERWPLMGTLYIFSKDQAGTAANVNNVTTQPEDVEFNHIVWTNVSQMDQTFKSLFTFSDDAFYMTFNNSYDYNVINCDYIVTSWQDLYDQLEEDNWISGGGSGGDPWLPNLTYNLSRKSTYVFPNVFDTKCFINWDYTEKEPYASNASEYVVDVQVSGSVNEAGVLNGENLVPQVGHILTLSSGGCNVAQNEFTFLYQGVGKQFYQTYGFNEFPPRDQTGASMASGYFLYIRTRHPTTNRTSPWKIFSAVGGQFFPVNKTVEGSDGDYTIDDVPEGELDNSDNSVILEYDSDNSNNAQDDPTSQMYDERASFNVSNLINNLKASVNSLSDLPIMLAQVVSFLPEWLISLIAVSIGMLVVIGVVKHIIR